MEILVEEAATEEKCLGRIQEKYGSNITILRKQWQKRDGFFGLFEKKVFVVTFSVYNKSSVSQTPIKEETKKEETITPPQKQVQPFYPLDDEVERRKILERASSKYENIAEKVKPYMQKIEKAALEEDEKLKYLTDTLEKFVQQIAKKNLEDEHENIQKITAILEENDFTNKYIKYITERIKKELTITELNDFDRVQKTVLDWISQSIKLESPPDDKEKGRVIALVGPTGVGKTTTLAKLAAYYVKIVSKKINRPLKVQVITIDKYRIGAVFQIKRYCDIMKIPLAIADSSDDLHKYLDLFKESSDVICIDTTGRSPSDHKNILEMQEYFKVIDNSNPEVYLTVSSVSKSSDILEIIKQYKLFDYKGLIITKLDETVTVGSIISTLHECGIPVVYITAGQEVPTNIQKAAKYTFLKKLKSFRLENEYLKENFDDEKIIIWH